MPTQIWTWLTTQCGGHDGVVIGFFLIFSGVAFLTKAGKKSLDKKLDKEFYLEAHKEVVRQLEVAVTTAARIEERLWQLGTKKKQRPLTEDTIKRANGDTL
jgi:hypothetical protein